MPGTSSGRTQAPRRSHDWLGFDCAKTDECITRGNSPPSALLPSLPQHLGGTHRYVLYHISAVRATQRLYRTSTSTREPRVDQGMSFADRVSHPVDRPRPSLHVPRTPRSAQIDSHRSIKSSHECSDLRIDSTEFIMQKMDPCHNQWIPNTTEFRYCTSVHSDTWFTGGWKPRACEMISPDGLLPRVPVSVTHPRQKISSRKLSIRAGRGVHHKLHISGPSGDW